MVVSAVSEVETSFAFCSPVICLDLALIVEVHDQLVGRIGQVAPGPLIRALRVLCIHLLDQPSARLHNSGTGVQGQRVARQLGPRPR